MLEVALVRTVVPGRVLRAWVELHSPGAWAGFHILAALVRAGRADTDPPGRAEAGWVLQ